MTTDKSKDPELIELSDSDNEPEPDGGSSTEAQAQGEEITQQAALQDNNDLVMISSP